MSIDKNLLQENLARLGGDSEIEQLDEHHRPRGLAERHDIESLAVTYLEEQTKHWPDLAKSGILPRATPKTLTAMAERFERAYVSSSPLPFDASHIPSGIDLATVYTRYSDANSNPRSLNQQLLNALTGAARNRQFVPWEYVFADAATTGTNENRRGYQLLKHLISQLENSFQTVYIDESGRASPQSSEA